MWNSFATTVSTPAKWPGRTAPSSSAPSGPGRRVVAAPAGYMSSTPGAKTSSTPSSRQVAGRPRAGAGSAARSSFGPNCSGLTKIDTTMTPAPGMRRACRINSRWPSCSAPIVGTSATRLPDVRSARGHRADRGRARVDGELARRCSRRECGAVVTGGPPRGWRAPRPRRAAGSSPAPCARRAVRRGQDAVGPGRSGVDGVEHPQVGADGAGVAAGDRAGERAVAVPQRVVQRGRQQRRDSRLGGVHAGRLQGVDAVAHERDQVVRAVRERGVVERADGLRRRGPAPRPSRRQGPRRRSRRRVPGRRRQRDARPASRATSSVRPVKVIDRVQGQREHAVRGGRREHGDPVRARGVHDDLARPEAPRGGEAADQAGQDVVGHGEQDEVRSRGGLVGRAAAGRRAGAPRPGRPTRGRPRRRRRPGGRRRPRRRRRRRRRGRRTRRRRRAGRAGLHSSAPLLVRPLCGAQGRRGRQPCGGPQVPPPGGGLHAPPCGPPLQPGGGDGSGAPSGRGRGRRGPARGRRAQPGRGERLRLPHRPRPRPGQRGQALVVPLAAPAARPHRDSSGSAGTRVR